MVFAKILGNRKTATAEAVIEFAQKAGIEADSKDVSAFIQSFNSVYSNSLDFPE